MGSARTFAFAGAAIIVAIPAAHAADLPPIIQRPPPPVVEEFTGGWYLRGDIGFSSQKVGELFNAQVNTGVPGIQSLVTPIKNFDGAPLFGAGVGYQFNSWLRADVTGEYRSPANFHGLQIVTVSNPFIIPPSQPDVYSASKSEFLFLANVYADLGTWWCITPFVGAGVGASWNTISNFVDMATNTVGNPLSGSTGFANAATTTNLAWAIHAGLAYHATPGMTVELAYRYLNLGSAQTGDLVSFDGTQNLGPIHFNDITSHDVTLGVRWMLAPADTPAYYPLVRKG